MPKYRVTDNETGESYVVTGEAPPTQDDVQELIADLKSKRAAAEATTIYSEPLSAKIGQTALGQGVAPEKVQEFLDRQKALQAEVPAPPELTAYAPPPEGVREPFAEKTAALQAKQADWARGRRDTMGNYIPMSKEEEAQAQTAQQLLNKFSREVEADYGIPQWVMKSGGGTADVALNLGFPIAGGFISEAVSGQPFVGAAVGSAIASPLVQLRQMARGERTEASPTEMATDVVFNTLIPGPMGKTIAEANALRAARGIPAMSPGQQFLESIATRGGQGAAMGLSGNLAKQFLEESSVDTKNALTVGTMYSLFGMGFGGLETGFPQVWQKIRNLRPKEARAVLAAEPQTEAVAKAIQDIDRLETQRAGAPGAVGLEGAPIEPLTAEEQLSTAMREVQPRERAAGAQAGAPRAVEGEAMPIEMATAEELAQGRATAQELNAEAEMKRRLQKAYGDMEANQMGWFEPAVEAEVAQQRAAASAIDDAMAKQDLKLANQAENAGDQVNVGPIGSEATTATRPIEVQLAELEQFNARVKRITDGIFADGGKVTRQEAAQLARITNPREFSLARQKILNATRQVAAPGETVAQTTARLKNLQELTPEMLGIAPEAPKPARVPEAPITPKSTGVLPGEIPVLPKAEPAPAGLGEPPFPISARMLELERPIYDSGMVDEMGNKVWVDVRGRAVNAPTFEGPRDTSRYAGRALSNVVVGAGLGGVGFVYGWNTGEGLPPEERLLRAVGYGAGGMFSPVAIRKIISLQGWADNVLRDRGPGSGALNTADPEILGALAVKGAAFVGEGVKDFAEWSKLMVREFGAEVKPKLKDIWAAGEQSKIIPQGAVMDAPAPKAPKDMLPSNTAGVLLYSDMPKSPIKKTNSEVAEEIQTAAIRANGRRITSNDITSAEREKIINLGVDEVVAGLKAGQHAGAWYTTAVDDANVINTVLFPALASDKAAKASGRFGNAREGRVAAAVAMAATSQNLTVAENGKYTVQQFEALLKDGKFDSKLAREYGTKAKSIAGNLELANDFVSQVGWSGLDEFIRRDFTVGELESAIKKAVGYSVKIAGKKDDIVQGAAIFGPKIGQGFLQNLLGRFDPVTIDLWMRRTWGRWTGDVLAENILPEQLGRYIKTLRDEGIDLPESLRGMRITPKGKNKLLIPESQFGRLETDKAWQKEIYDHALNVFGKWNDEMYPRLKGMMTPEQRARILSGDLSLDVLSRQIGRMDAEIESKWQALKEKPRGKGAKEQWVRAMEEKQGRTAELSNEQISKLKPEWAKSSTVIVDVFEPIDVPSGRDREVITDVVNGIRKKLEDRGIRMTNADIQATLWYPEKDIWAKVAGRDASKLKQSYDSVFLKIAEERGLGDRAREALDIARTARARRTDVAGPETAAGEGTARASIAAKLSGKPELDVATAEQIAKANASSRAGGAVGINAVTPRYVQQTSKPGERILDFGAGKTAQHAKALREAGFDVTAHEFGGNQNPEIHDLSALTRKYDTVYASNVLNVQGSKDMLRNTLRQIKDSTEGRAVFNYPREPRYSGMRPDDVRITIKEVFGRDPVRVGGTPSEPIWEVRPAVDKRLEGQGLSNPAIAGFVAKQLGLPLAGFAGGFAVGMIEGRDRPPEERLARSLILGAASGALSPLVLNTALKTIGTMSSRPSSAAQKVIGSVTPTRTLDDVRNIFKPEPNSPAMIDRLRALPGKAITTIQNRFYPLTELQESVLGYLPKLNLGDRFSMISGATGRAEADMHDLDKLRQQLIPDIHPDDLNSYLFLRRAYDRLTTEAAKPQAGSRKVGDYSIPEIQRLMGELHTELGTAKMTGLENFANELQKSANADLQLMVRSGRMSQKQYADIKAMNDFYAPFAVMEYMSQAEGALPGVMGAIDTTQPLTQSIKGIHDKNFKLGDMMTAFAMNKVRANVLAEKNVMMNELAALAPLDQKGVFIRDLGPAAAGINPPKGFETVSYMKDGVVQHLAVQPEVANAVKHMDAVQAGLITNILSTAATPFKAGAVGLNTSFQVVNQFKDLGRLGLVSRYGLRSVGDLARFPLDVAVAAASSWKSNLLGKPDQLMMDYLRSGAARSTIASSLSPDTFTRVAQQADQSAAAKLMGVPLRTIIDTATRVGNAIEETSKLAGFRRGMRLENLDKLSPAAREQAIQRIAYEVRNYAGSPDFSKHGTIGKELNLLFMFLNARIQGTAADLRRLSGGTGTKEAWDAALKLATGVGGLTTYVWYMNHQPENAADFQNRPLTERNNYFLIPRYNKAGQPMYYINEDGDKVREYWRFPKAEIIGQVANITEGALDFFARRDPKAAMEAGINALENLSPISISGRNIDERFESMASGLNPVIKAPMEYLTNRNLFGHRDIVPRNLIQASPEMQYRETTAPAFITAAQAMPSWAPDKMRSPLQLQQLASNFTGGLLTQFMRPELEGRDPLSANPVIGRFFSAPYLDREENWNEIKKYQTQQTDQGLTRERAIDVFLKNADKMPVAEKIETLRRIVVADPERNVRALVNNMKDKAAGTTNIDRAVRSLQPNLRAQYLEDQRAKLATPEEQAQYYMTMYRRGVLTPDTVNEIAKLRKIESEIPKKP